MGKRKTSVCKANTHSRVEQETLLDSELGRSWLAQFDDADRIAAIRLINGLEFISLFDLETGIINATRGASDTGEKVAVFAVREIADEIAAGGNYFGDAGDTRHKPIAVRSPNKVGSEGRVAQIIAKLCRTEARYLDHPSIAEMRTAKVRHIYLVSDFLGSGKQCADMLRHMYQHSTIKSWTSFGWIRFHAIAFAATVDAIDYLNGCHPEVIPQIATGCPTFETQGWSKSELWEVVELCKRYGRRTRFRRDALGYGGVKALIVFPYSIPNNAPSILWSSSKTWQPVFPLGTVPSSLLALFDRSISLATRLHKLRQHRLSEADDIVTHDAEALVILLAALSRRFGGRRTPYLGLSTVTGLSIPECKALLVRCIAGNLVDEQKRLTEAGRFELSRLRREARTRRRQRVDTESEYYYPKSLRGP